MKQNLITLLSSLGYPVSQQGSYEEGTLPNSFFTFWNYDTEPVFYSNGVKRILWVFRINFYSNDPALTNIVLKSACALLRQNNYHVGGEYDIASGVQGYTARQVEINYIEEEI